MSASPVTLPWLSHRLSAGFPSPADDYAEESLNLNDYLIRNRPASFLFTVKGHSMVGACIQAGDVVVVDRSITACHGDIVVASVQGEFTLKRLYQRAGVVQLRAEHPEYAPIEIKEGMEFSVWGVVVGVARRYGR